MVVQIVWLMVNNSLKKSTKLLFPKFEWKMKHIIMKWAPIIKIKKSFMLGINEWYYTYYIYYTKKLLSSNQIQEQK